jgi:L-lactate dehydrogenase (cytochrome)
VGLHGRPHTFGNIASALPGAVTPRDFKAWIDNNFDPSVTWADLAWVREHWKGRLVLKGILDPEDARQAVDTGMDAIVVSNHGGRQLDDTPSSVTALPRVIDAVGHATEVLVDGGVRSGLDVAKMLALGARACLVGRAWAWSVAAGGQRGVADMLRIVRGELEVALSLTGAADVAALDRTALVGEPAD